MQDRNLFLNIKVYILNYKVTWRVLLYSIPLFFPFLKYQKLGYPSTSTPSNSFLEISIFPKIICPPLLLISLARSLRIVSSWIHSVHHSTVNIKKRSLFSMISLKFFPTIVFTSSLLSTGISSLFMYFCSLPSRKSITNLRMSDSVIEERGYRYLKLRMKELTFPCLTLYSFKKKGIIQRKN